VKVCGIVGSPKKNGNVDLLVSQVLKGAQSRGAETSKIYLNDLAIKPCQSCGTDPHPKHCLFNDDMNMIYDALESSDVIVLGSPVYFNTVSAQTKIMIDRCNCMTPYIKHADGTFSFEKRVKKHKKGVFVAVAGSDQEFETITNAARAFFHWVNAELDETVEYPHQDAELGGVRNIERMMSRAFNVGVQIVE
jgi:multimeric flavodoxin WrbA